jgi:hypothetical protein
VGSSVPVDVLERAAAEAERDFYEGFQHSARTDAVAKRQRKPTPFHGAGTYRYVAGEEGPPASQRVEAAGPESVAPPRKRRYPQTSPGRRKTGRTDSSAGAGGESERRDGARPGRGGSGLQFGERFLTNRTLDEVILEFLSRHLDS